MSQTTNQIKLMNLHFMLTLNIRHLQVVLHYAAFLASCVFFRKSSLMRNWSKWSDFMLKARTNKFLGCFNLGSNMDKPSHWVTFFNYIFNPTFGFVHIWPIVGLKQASIFRVPMESKNLNRKTSLFPWPHWRCSNIKTRLNIASHSWCFLV